MTAFSLRLAIRSLVIDVMLVPERWRSGVGYNPLSARVAQNPYPIYMVTKPEWSISDVRKCVAHAPRLAPSGREPVRRRTAQAPSRPTITTEQTFWWGKPPRLWVRPSTGSFSRWRSPARPSIWR